jgi:hypothetical protein
MWAKPFAPPPLSTTATFGRCKLMQSSCAETKEVKNKHKLSTIYIVAFRTETIVFFPNFLK